MASQGQISGEDGQRYTFARPDWRESYWPARGQVVDFEANTDRAGNIYVLQGSGTGAVTGSKDKVAAALLAFFLGCFGAHKFYLNKTGAAVTMLLCGTIGWMLVLPGLIIAIIAFIEFIIYLVIDDAEFQRRYVQGNQSWF
jgi:TM2 domain-containing membrane protein YozV